MKLARNSPDWTMDCSPQLMSVAKGPHCGISLLFFCLLQGFMSVTCIGSLCEVEKENHVCLGYKLDST